MYFLKMPPGTRLLSFFYALPVAGVCTSGWLSACESEQAFSPPEEQYIREYCRGDEYDRWIRLPAGGDITGHFTEAGFVIRQPVGTTSTALLPTPFPPPTPSLEMPDNNNRKRSMSQQLYVFPEHLGEWVGDDVYFFCRLGDSYAQHSIKWFHNGRRICHGGNLEMEGPRLGINPITPEDIGIYECEFRGVRSRSAELLVWQNIRAEASRVMAEPGQPATLSCKVTEGLPAPRIHWFRVNSPDQVNFNLSVIFDYTEAYQHASGDDINFRVNGEFLQFDAVEEKDYGIIRCWVYNILRGEYIISELLRPGVLIVFPYPDQSYTISQPLAGVNTNTGLCALRDVNNPDDTPPEIIADAGQVQVCGLGGRLALFGFDKARRYRAFKGIEGGMVKNTGLTPAETTTAADRCCNHCQPFRQHGIRERFRFLL